MLQRIRQILSRMKRSEDVSSDRELLLRYIQHRDHSAFELLVWRHAGLVMSTCRQTLRDTHAAEDAFQATFLILARKAKSIRGSLPAWLHTVARRVCYRMQKRKVPQSSAILDDIASRPATTDAELRDLLESEIHKLSEKLRLVVLMCYIEGRTAEETAGILGIPRGTVLSRLSSARDKLTRNLRERGVVPAVALATLGTLTEPACSRELVTSVHELVVADLAGNLPSTSIFHQLALEVIHMSVRSNIAVATLSLVLVAGVGSGIAFVVAQEKSQPVKQPDRAEAPLVVEKPAPPTTTTAQERATKLKSTQLKLEKQIQEMNQVIGVETPESLRKDLERLRAEYLNVQREHNSKDYLVKLEKLREAEREAELNVERAEAAVVSEEWIKEALERYPTVIELRNSIREKRSAMNKLPKENPERVILGKAIEDLEKKMEAIYSKHRPEVISTLRVPKIIEARQIARNISLERMAHIPSLDWLEKQLEVTMKKLERVEPVAEELILLKEQRKKIREQLLALELDSKVEKE